MKVIVRIISLLLIIILWALPHTSSAEEIEIVKEKKEKEEEEQRYQLSPLIIEGKALLSIEDISQILGVEFAQENNKTLVGQKDDTEFHIPLDEEFIVINRSELQENAPSRLFNGEIHVPFRIIAEALDYELKWEEETKTITVAEQDQVDIKRNEYKDAEEEEGEEGEDKDKEEEEEAEVKEEGEEEQEVVSTYQGTASYYGSRFHGQQTASGEVYDMYEKTAAHRELPFGTKVRVTFLQSGESTIVRINDRGPFKQGRIIDLSKEAARAIGLKPYGLGEVKLEVLDS